MKTDKNLSLEKLDRELRAAGIEFTSLTLLRDGTVSLRDREDQEIKDDRVAAVVEQHVPDPPRKRLGQRLAERWGQIKPGENVTPRDGIRALTLAFEAFLEEQAKEEEEPEFLPMQPVELQPFAVPEPIQESEEDIAAAEEQQRQDAERQATLDILTLARTMAQEQGVSDAEFTAAILRIAVQEKESRRG